MVIREPVFASEEHRSFFYTCLQQSGNRDAYHQALFYTLGISAETRGNIHHLFNFEEDRIRPDGLQHGWQTGGTRRLCRMAFNLWNGYTEEGHENLSTPYEMFDCSFAPYMMEGIRLRYPEYCRELTKAPHSAELMQ